MLTIFSIPKKFTGQFDNIQRNAITSWTKISPKVEIILFGSDTGTKDICRELKIKHVPDIKRNHLGTPLLDDIFDNVKKYSQNNTLAFILADIILINNPLKVIEKVNKRFNRFLLIGQRYEAKDIDLVNFNNNNWKDKLANKYMTRKKPKGPSWMDYFIFTKNTFDKIPPFAVGRTFWDKWLIWSTLQKNIPVVDCTASITAIHQSHDYSHTKGAGKEVWEGEEARENIRLAGGWGNGRNISNSTYIFNISGIKKITQNKYLQSYLDILKNQLTKYQSLNPLILKTRSLLNKI